jgi:hypothetical protein
MWKRIEECLYRCNKDENDNYTEIVQNILRPFDDKKSIREKIVNKSIPKQFF